jgi:hypothetical protein
MAVLKSKLLEGKVNLVSSSWIEGKLKAIESGALTPLRVSTASHFSLYHPPNLWDWTNFLPFPDEDTIYFELPKLPLAAGRYSFVVSLFMNAELIDEYVPETLLIVENGDFYGTGRAALPAFAPVCVEYDCYLKGRKGLHPLPSQPVPETVPGDSDEA